MFKWQRDCQAGTSLCGQRLSWVSLSYSWGSKALPQLLAPNSTGASVVGMECVVGGGGHLA